MSARKVIALVLNTEGLRDDYQGVLRRGVEQACMEQDLDLWVLTIRADQRPQEVHVNRLLEVLGPERVSGVIVATTCIESWASGEHAIDHLHRRGVHNLCSVGQKCSRASSILVDNRGGATALVNHVVRSHARRHFVYVGGPPGHEEAEQRYGAFVDALAAHGLRADASGTYRGDWSVEAGQEAIQQFVSREIPFDAVVAANDEMALGVLAVLRAIGMRCPDDVSVVGFDNVAAARFCQPSLTTASQPLVKLGANAVRRIVQNFNNTCASVEPLVMNTELVLRESCGCNPTYVDRNQGPSSRRGSRRTLREELRGLLLPVFDGEDQRDWFALELVSAVTAELAGRVGALRRVVDCMALRTSQPYVPLYELQRVISCLRDFATEQGMTPGLEESFHALRVLLSSHAYRREGEKRMHSEYLLESLRVCGERLAKCLSRTDMRRVLANELPRLGILNAFVALVDGSDSGRLVPLVSVADGGEHIVDPAPYSAAQLVPKGVFNSSRRQTLTVLPLMCETEYLGIAVLELPEQIETYSLLREQIGTAIKTAALHQEVLAKERLHAQTQEERRLASERLHSLNLIAGGVAHDLNNALGPLVALPDAIECELANKLGKAVPEEIRKDLALIRAVGQRAALTIRDLIAFGRPSASAENALDLTRVLEQERSALLAICERDKHIQVHLEPSPLSLVVLIDRTQFLRAVTNLIINAADAIEDAGTIIVRARFEQVAERLDGIEPIEPGSYAVVDVVDDGQGISDKNLPRILEPFFSEKKRSGSSGTGLGLAIVQRIVKEANGYLYVKSKLGHGSTFSLYFPSNQHAGEYQCPKSDAPTLVVGGTERILIVDDEEVQLRTAKRILEQLGYEVITVNSGREALELVRHDHTGFDLVVVDMIMPGGIDGIETVERLRERSPHQRALMVSGYAPERMDAAVLGKQLAWLSKPYTRTSLAGGVRGALDAIEPESAIPISATLNR